MKTNRKYFSFYDIFIILIVVAVSVLAFVTQFNNDASQLKCVIRVEGEVVEEVLLSLVTEPYSLQIEGELPVVVYFTDSSAKVQSSACPDKLCEHSGEITRSGQSVVCLPAKVSITLESENASNEFDAVVG